MRVIDPDAVYRKALSHPNAVAELDRFELLSYAVKELETYIAMSGLNAFFTGSCSYLYDDLRQGLELCRDAQSLSIIDDFAKRVVSDGHQFPNEVEEWIHSRSETPDWGRHFRDATAERWRCLAGYVQSAGHELSTTNSASDARVEALQVSSLHC